MLLRTFVFAFCLHASLAAAEWYTDYQQGIEMIKKRNWTGAISNLQSAIRQKDQEAGILNLYEKTYGDYYPHYYLAMAHYYSEQYRQALAEFDKSTGYGAIQKNPELYQKLKDLRSLAAAQLAPREPGKPESDPAIAKEVETKQAESQTIQNEVPAESQNKNVREWIRIGARKYFEGNFDDAIALLSQLLRQAPETVSAQFLLGCAYASKYLLSGSQDRGLFDKAAAAFQNAKRIDPNFAASQNPYISPAILQIYQES